MNIAPLILFNEKVDRLETCRLTARMEISNYTVQYDKIMNLNWIAVDGISPDDIDAFVLNLRLLIQDKDGFSIRCLSKIYAKNNIPQELSEAFDKQRQKWQAHKKSETLFIKPNSDKKYSHGELFYILFYGGLAHQDKKYINQFLWLTRQGAFSAFVFTFFISSLKTILDVVRNIREVNKNLIEIMKKITTASSSPPGSYLS